MTRKEVYAIIKKYDLAEEVKNQFGENYTRVSTDNLEKVIYDYDCTLVGEPENEAPKATETPVVSEINKSVTTIENPYEGACLTFLGILKDLDLLDSLLEKL